MVTMAINSDYVWLHVRTGASDWRQVDVFDADRLIARSTSTVPSADGSFVFDGRDSSGQVLSTVRLSEVRAMDENGNVGEGCRAAVQLEQVVSLQ